MSEAADTPAFEEVEPAAPPAPINSLRGMIFEPAVRNYLIAGTAALGMVFLVMMSSGADIGGAILFILGLAGMLMRWPAVPSFFLLILLFFLVFPFFDPSFSYSHISKVRDGHFQVDHVLLAFSVVTYLACHYRVYGLAANGLPYEQRRWRKHARRPADLVAKGELPRFFWLAGAVVLVGQFIWFLATTVEVDVNDDFPLHMADDAELYGRRESGMFPLFVLRLIVLLGIGFFGTLIARIVFGYWRLRTMSAAEGALMVQEAGWSETHRERTRLEKWLAWRREKNKSDAEKET